MPSLLLLSLGARSATDFLRECVPSGVDVPTIGYVPDAARAFADAPFVAAERERVARLGYPLVDVTLTGSTPDQVAAALASVDALYVAGGDTFALLDAIAESGAAPAIRARVNAGMAYIGSSAGAIIAGPSIEPASLLDDPDGASAGRDLTGLRLTTHSVIPHADGLLPPYPPALIAQTIERYADRFDLIPLRDDQALRIDGGTARVVPS